MNNINNRSNLNSNEIENSSKFVALSSSFTALVFIATAIFALAIAASGGYFNFGESMVYLAALVGGPIVGFIAGAVGSSLADVTTGYGFFAPGTFIIKGIEGYVAGYLFLKLRKLDANEIKRIYAIFSGFFILLSVALSTPSIWEFVGKLVNGTISFGNFPFDIGSYNFNFSSNLYLPQINNFEIFHLENFLYWSPDPAYSIGIDIPGFLIITIAILFVAFIWYLYFNYGEKSKIIISSAVSGSLMVTGYFIYETILIIIPILSYTFKFGLGITPAQAFGEVPFNILQVIIGIVIVVPVYTYLANSGIISSIEKDSTSESN